MKLPYYYATDKDLNSYLFPLKPIKIGNKWELAEEIVKEEDSLFDCLRKVIPLSEDDIGNLQLPRLTFKNTPLKIQLNIKVEQL